MISNYIWPVMWLFFRLNDMKMQRGFLKAWRIEMEQSLMLGCSILWYTHTAKLERSQNHKTCSGRWRAWVFLCQQSHSIVWWLFKILFQMQRLVCGRWSSNNSLLVVSAEPGSDSQACDNQLYAYLYLFYNAWILDAFATSQQWSTIELFF